jgi:hypothetical protein
MKKVKIIKSAELTYQKTIHVLDAEVDGVIYTAYRVEDCNGADTEFADPDNVPLEAQQAIDSMFCDYEYACSDIASGEVFEVNMDDCL